LGLNVELGLILGLVLFFFWVSLLETRTHINPSLCPAVSFLGFEVLVFVQQKQELGVREVKEEEEG
jgi:hypothetical protein